MIYTHAAAALVALAMGFTGGWQVRAWKAGQDDAERLQAQAQAAQAGAARADAAAAGHETVRAGLQQQRRVLIQEVERVVEKPVYRDVCLDADGLRIIAAAAGAAPAASQPAGPVSDPDPAD